MRIALIFWAALGMAAPMAEVTPEQIKAWIDQKPLIDTPPGGTTISGDGLDSLQAWIPPGFYDELAFPGLALRIQDSQDYAPHSVYLDASRRYAGQATIGVDGSLQNYTAGQPFSYDQIVSAAPDEGGYMVAWNQIHRWQHYGWTSGDMRVAYIGPAEGEAPLAPELGLQGGGNLLRVLTFEYHRVYLNHLAMLSKQSYRVDTPHSDTRFYKDHIGFLEPFNVKGTSFIVERMLDPHADDQVNTYLPTERRVRRFSAKERADSFMGSNATLDDIEGFSGRVLDHSWSLLGEKRLLAVVDGENLHIQTYGPFSRVPDDRWQFRDCYVVEVHSVWDEHPYGSRIMFIDKQTFNIPLVLVIGREGRLFKTIQTIFQRPSHQDGQESSMAHSVPIWQASIYINMLTNTSNVVKTVEPATFPTMRPKAIKRLFSVSSLGEGM